MEGGELKRQRRESSSSIQVTQGDNAPLLVQDSVGAQIFFVLVLLLCVFFLSSFFSFFFFVFFSSSSKFFQKKKFFFRFFFRVVVLLHTFDFATLREKKTTRNTHTVTRRKEHVSGIAFFLSFFFL